MCVDSIQRSGDTVAILIRESLTEDDVRVVGEFLIVKPPTADVIVDVRRMRTEEGAAMALLLRLLERSGAPYSFVGLNSVQERVWRYLAPEIGGRKRRDREARDPCPGPGPHERCRHE